jgi:hypothetical protein
MARVPSLKHMQVDKANSRILLIAGIAVFLTIFSLVSSKSLYTQMTYQNRVAKASQTALNQLRADNIASGQLETTYTSFEGNQTNLIGGSSTGTGGSDGDNAKVVLDALPSQYDYPALTTSIQYLLNSAGVNIDSISGTDEQASVDSNGALTGTTTAATTTPTTTTAVPGTAVAMPFQFSADGPYANIQKLFAIFESSIRPLPFQTVSVSGAQNDLTLTVAAQSYYQPQKSFQITTETVQ